MAMLAFAPPLWQWSGGLAGEILQHFQGARALDQRGWGLLFPGGKFSVRDTEIYANVPKLSVA